MRECRAHRQLSIPMLASGPSLASFFSHLVEFLLDVRSHVLLNSVLGEGSGGHIDSLLLHLLHTARQTDKRRGGAEEQRLSAAAHGKSVNSSQPVLLSSLYLAHVCILDDGSAHLTHGESNE